MYIYIHIYTIDPNTLLYMHICSMQQQYSSLQKGLSVYTQQDKDNEGEPTHVYLVTSKVLTKVNDIVFRNALLTALVSCDTCVATPLTTDVFGNMST